MRGVEGGEDFFDKDASGGFTAKFIIGCRLVGIERSCDDRTLFSFGIRVGVAIAEYFYYYDEDCGDDTEDEASVVDWGYDSVK